MTTWNPCTVRLDILLVKVQIIDDSWALFPSRANCFEVCFLVSRRAAWFTPKQRRWRSPRKTKKTFPHFLSTKFQQLYFMVIYSLLYFWLQKFGRYLNVKVRTRRERNEWCHTCVVVVVYDAVVIKSNPDCEPGNTLFVLLTNVCAFRKQSTT